MVFSCESTYLWLNWYNLTCAPLMVSFWSGFSFSLSTNLAFHDWKLQSSSLLCGQVLAPSCACLPSVLWIHLLHVSWKTSGRSCRYLSLLAFSPWPPLWHLQSKVHMSTIKPSGLDKGLHLPVHFPSCSFSQCYSSYSVSWFQRSLSKSILMNLFLFFILVSLVSPLKCHFKPKILLDKNSINGTFKSFYIFLKCLINCKCFCFSLSDSNLVKHVANGKTIPLIILAVYV